MKKVTAIACLVVIGCAQLAFGEGKDYGSGFDKFFKLGLPDVSTGKYVRLEITYRNNFSTMQGYSYMSSQLKFRGNAWLLSETTNGTATLVMDNGRRVEVVSQKVIEQKLKKLAEEQSKATGKVDRAYNPYTTLKETGGRWAPADITNDVQAAITYLKKQKENPDRNELKYNGAIVGALFFRSALLYRNGYTNEANQITDLLFAASGDPRKVVKMSLNQLADDQYALVYEGFSGNHDWKAYAKGIDAIAERFPTGWQKMPGVKKLATLIKQRIEKPEPSAITGEGLTEEDKKLAKDLATEIQSNQFPYYGGDLENQQIWLFNTQGSRRSYGRPSTGQTNAIDRIKKRGMTSVPLLIALLKDGYLTSLSSHRGVSYSSFNVPDFDVDENKADKYFDILQRPYTRGEIAKALLTSLILVSDQDSYRMREMSPEDVQEECIAWYKENKGKPVQELAKIYFDKGNSNQKQQALSYLMTAKGTNTDFSVIEKAFLTSPDVSRDSYMVQQYVQARGEKAKDFVEKYAKAVGVTKKDAADKNKAVTGTGPDGDGNVDENADYNEQNAERTIKELRAIVAAPPLKEILEKLALTDNTEMYSDNSLTYGLNNRLAKEDPTNALTMILEAAVKASDEKKIYLIQLANGIPYARLYAARGIMIDSPEQDEDGDGEDAEMPVAQAGEPPVLKLNPKDHAKLWKQILEGSKDSISDEAGMSVGSAVVEAIEALYCPPKDGFARNFDPSSEQAIAMADRYMLHALGDRGYDVLRKRAEAILDGVEQDKLPKLPSSKDVTDEQKQKMVTTLLAARDPAAALTNMPLNQLLVLPSLVATNNTLNKQLHPVADRINKLIVPTSLTEVGKSFQSIKGRNFDKATVEQILNTCSNIVKEGRSVSVTLTRASIPMGTVMHLQDQSQFAAMQQGFMGSGRGSSATMPSTITASFSIYPNTPGMMNGEEFDESSAVNAYTTWTFKNDSKEKKPDAAVKEKTGKGDVDELLEEASEGMDQSMDSENETSAENFWKKLELGLTNNTASAIINLNINCVVPPKPKEEKKDEPKKNGAAEVKATIIKK